MNSKYTCYCRLIKVLIRVYAAGVNPADTYIRSGAYYRLPDLPYTPGFDTAGVIEQIGYDVKKFKVHLFTIL